ncbi:MAG: quinolinate synthase NadA [bacterium]|nr:quinolinate synthase NadA [bacterium]
MDNLSITEKIKALARERDAIILAHNYTRPEIQDLADFVGDSLELSRTASKLSSKVILFCGVYFMAETAYILSPDKTVLIPDPYAGCPMADMITGEQLRRLKKEYPNAKVICYVNSTAEVKAESDICCTSANAIDIVNRVDSNDIIFVPDKNLGAYVSRMTGKRLILWQGYCPIHAMIKPEDIIRAKQEHPYARVVVHPECSEDVIALADAVRSTSGMLRYVKETDAKEFIIGTESGILYRMRKENPEKQFFPVRRDTICVNMKKITLEKILDSLEKDTYRVIVPEDIRIRALKSIERMLM